MPIKNRAHWRAIVTAEIAETLKPYELYLDYANQLWIQAVNRKKWVMPPDTYSIEAHVQPGAVIHPLTRKRLS